MHRSGNVAPISSQNWIVTTSLLVLFLWGCSSTSDLYKSEKLSNNSFTNYKTYAFMPTNDTAYTKIVDRKPFEKMLATAVKAQLDKRGMRMDTANPDCLFTYILKMNRNYEVSQGQYMEYKPEVYEPAFDNHARIYTFSSDNKPVVYAGNLNVDTLREGSIVIDMIDVKENKVVWRSAAEGKRPET